MLMIEIMVALVVLGVLGFGLLGWLFRPLARKLRDQLRLENQIEANRRQFEAERARLKSAARGELEEWMKQRAGEATGISPAAPARLQSPVLQAILERYPLDDRVLELAQVYRQATGKELLPEALRPAQAAHNSGDAGRATERPAAGGQLSKEEARLLEEARREVQLWMGGAGSSGSGPDTETKR